MENVKIGKFLDDEGNQISDVEKVLNSLDVELRDNNLQFRNMGEVLEDTMVVWKQLGAEGRTVEQQMIAVAFAGQRQSNIFTALMNDQDKYNEALKIEAESLGLVEQRYTIFTDNIEANKNRFKASWEEMWSTTITDESIINITKFGTAVLNLISNMGGLIPVVGTLTGLFVTLRNVSMASGLAFTSILGPIGLIITAVSAVSAVFNAFHRTAQEIQTDFNSTISQYDDSVDELERLKTAYVELTNKQNKNADDLRELLDIQSTLVLKYGAAKEGVDLYTDAVNNNSAAIQENIKWLEQQGLKEAERFLKINKEDYEKALKYLNQKQYVPGTMFNDYKGQELSQQDYLDYLAEVIAKGNDTNGVYRKQYDTISENLKIYQEIVATYREYYAIVNDVTGTDDPITRRGAQEEYGELSEAIKESASSLEDLADATEAANDATSTASSGYASLTSILESYNQTKSLTINQAQELINAGYGEALSIDALTGAITIDAAMLRQLAIAKADSAIVALQNQLAIYQETTAIEAQEADLVNNINLWRQRKAAIVGASADTVSLLKAIGGFSGFSSVGGGGASAKAVDGHKAETDAINAKIKALNRQKDALQDTLKQYKDIIDAQKEKLKLDKEEKDYARELADKNKELVDIDNDLLALQFDNSQEANAKRLELEELRAEKAAEIAEFQADRTYDIQIEALDREYEAFKAMIDKQIDAIDLMIEKFQEMIEAINAVADAMNNMSGGGGYGGRDSTSTSDSKLSLPNKPVGSKSKPPAGLIWGSGGVISKDRLTEEGFSQGGMGIIPDGHPNDSFPLMAESGEMFMIFNKQQQQQLARGARIPSMGSIVANTQNSGGGITVGDISISVAGNLDKVALGDIKTAVFDVLNSASNQRGKRANALTYSL